MSTKPTREELEQRIGILEEELANVRRKKEELRENAEMFEDIINGVSMLITYMDCEERYVFVNRAYAQWYGLSRQEVIGKRAADILKPDVYERASLNIKKVLSGQHVSYENKIIDKDGRERYVRVNYEPCYRGEEVKGFYTSIVDITENRWAEEALRESESHMKSISDNLPDIMIYQIIAKTDGTRQITYLSDSVRKMYGISPEEGMADPALIYDSIHEDDIASLVKAEDEALKTLSTFRMEARVREPSGGIRWSAFSSTPSLMSDGSTRWNGIELVISERKRLEEILKKSEENFRRSLDDSPLGARIVSAKGETIYANQTFLNIYDCKGIEELQAIPAKERYTPESYAEHLTRSEKRKRGEFVPSEYEVSIIRKDGEIRHLQVIRKEILWNGQPQFQVLYNDITKRKRAEMALQESEEKYRYLVKYAPAGIIEVDLNTNCFVSVNDIICEYTGYTRDELMNATLFDLLTEESQKLMIQRRDKLYAGEQISNNFEYSVKT
ncbi:MAG: multi-sensor signal transduction histidine kinase, partial [Deltaproteobacteria bacterium]|nr:multi-sensor signal transduction histidine kinase [Deltaproteobacteria bacterium]